MDWMKAFDKNSNKRNPSGLCFLLFRPIATCLPMGVDFTTTEYRFYYTQISTISPWKAFRKRPFPMAKAGADLGKKFFLFELQILRIKRRSQHYA